MLILDSLGKKANSQSSRQNTTTNRFQFHRMSELNENIIYQYQSSKKELDSKSLKKLKVSFVLQRFQKQKQTNISCQY